jgi:PadR family transcriptional regulator, regulatory protein PadR
VIRIVIPPIERAGVLQFVLHKKTYNERAVNNSNANTHILTIALCMFYLAEQMPRGDFLGSLEQIVMLAVMRLGTNAYGMTVRREIEERTGREISIGAVYATLERLEAKGYVSSFTGEPTAERGGRAKRHFEIEAAGHLALNASQNALKNMSEGLSRRWKRA